MTIHDRLSKVSPRSLPLLNRSVHRVTGEYLFSGEELVSLQESKPSTRRARIKTKLTLKYPDASVLNRVYVHILKSRIQTGALYFSVIIALSIGIAYLVFLQLPRAYTIGHNIPLDPVNGSSYSKITLNLYLHNRSGQEENVESVESMLYKTIDGSKAFLAKDEFWNWLLRGSEKYSTDTANVTIDKNMFQAYRTFFSEFMDLKDTLQARTVDELDIPKRRVMYEYIIASEYAGAKLALNKSTYGSEKYYIGEDLADFKSFMPFCFTTPAQDLFEGCLFAINYNNDRINISLKKVDTGYQKIDFLNFSGSSGQGVPEKRDLIWYNDKRSSHRNPRFFTQSKGPYSVIYVGSNETDAVRGKL